MRTSRAVKLAAPLALAAISIAACGSSSSGSKSSSGGSEPTYTIGYEGPLSGGDAQLGIYMDNALKLAVQQADAGTTFGKLPFKLAYQAEDDQGSATAAPAAGAKLLGIKNLIAVVGPAFSGASRAVDPSYAKAGVAIVTPSATAADLATNGWHNFFRVVADDNSQGPNDAQFMGKVLKAGSVYVINDASAYAAGLTKSFTGATSANGLTVTKSETVPGTTQCQEGSGNVQQYGPEAQKIVSSGAKSVFYGGYYCGLALLAKQLNSHGYKGAIVSDDGAEADNYVSQAGKSVAEGTYASCACQEVITGSAFSNFATAYKNLNGSAPGTYSAEAYDAANSIIKVMAAKGANVTKQDVIDGLHAPGFSYQGVSKTVTFAANGNYSGTNVYMYQVKNGTFTELGLISKLVSQAS